MPGSKQFLLPSNQPPSLSILVFYGLGIVALFSGVHSEGVPDPNSCSSSQSTESCSDQTNEQTFAMNGGTVVAFYGNPGSGKSTLLNTIVRRLEFPSGIHLHGLTKEWKQYAAGEITYVDTPGLSDPLAREEAAKQIEASLKTSKNYKIIFVASPTSARISAADLHTINTVCDTIKTNFTYGLILNKISPTVEKLFQESDSTLKTLLQQLHKQPSNILMVNKISNLEDANNVLVEDESVRKQLTDFIEILTASPIPKEKVEPIDIETFEEKIAKVEQKYQKEIDALKTDLGNSIQFIEEEFKTEEGVQFERTREHVKKHWKRDTVTTIAEQYVPWTKYRRNKLTKRNGQVEYSEWYEQEKGEKMVGFYQAGSRHENEWLPF